ncbi:MAG: TonB-dependent receptor [Alphaproteobacteria bacterium]|nr:TonB-dependent receptor [Alphaproteobacteria bacterium]MBU1513480.1 TonB-dependent receptor [Alphaproteobacteria bacterium]MBU2096472.1 TonB-dependent receptor [Alphaproteobacteria bacterium]MBU2149836.1 TonB-dependent receptor [Alphaproteobacteria bacterium]MBU2308258.1 TonB-dependent receptor [Alphaproteobacteria bacterium]
MGSGWGRVAVLAAGLAWAGPVAAQRVNDNTVATAEDAFGASIGTEKVGLYSASDVRGFSPVTAGNIRLEGLYVDRPASFTDRLVESNTVRVGLASQNYLFPAPTGIVDYKLRRAGPERIVSVLAGYGPMGGGRVEVDAQLPLAANLSLAAGAAIFEHEYASGVDPLAVSYGLVARWRPAPGAEIIPFWSRIDDYDREAVPLYVAGSTGLPPHVSRRTYPGPVWADQRNTSNNYGILARGPAPGGVQVAAILFRSENRLLTNYASVFSDFQPDGTARLRINRDPSQGTDSTSGELRASRTFAEGDRRHTVYASLRGRRREATYGGGVATEFGRVTLGVPITVAQPAFAPRAGSVDRVDQWTGGIAYDGRWRNRGSLNLGLQRTDYRKRVARPGVAVSETHDPTWLYNGALAVDLRRDLAAYGSITRGLEESGVAPDSAANRGEALPAILTDQWDAGVRWVIAKDLRVVAGLFQVEKPYFSFDDLNVFREQGHVRHRGAEFSLTGQPVKGLTIVAGAVLMSPRVSGDPVDEGRIGRKPVGQTRRLLTLSGTYALPAPGMSLTFAANHHGDRTGDQANRVKVPARTIFDAGVRYRFEAGGTPALLRFQVTNLANTFDWKVVSSGAYEANQPRTFSLFLTMDF